MTYNNNKVTQHALLRLITIILLLTQISSKANILYPVAFTVVRYSSISGNLSQYMQNIGYPNIDENGNNIGYNIISLDGYKTGMTFSSINN